MNQQLQTYGITPGTGYLEPIRIVKPENESRTNSIVIAQDKDLVIPINPGISMYWKALLFFYIAAGAPGNANSQWTTPAVPTAGGASWKYIDAAGAVQDNNGGAVAAVYNNPVFNYFTTTAGQMYTVFFEGMLINGANGGYFSLNWSQNVANLAPTVLLKGSRLEAWMQ